MTAVLSTKCAKRLGLVEESFGKAKSGTQLLDAGNCCGKTDRDLADVLHKSAGFRERRGAPYSLAVATRSGLSLSA